MCLVGRPVNASCDRKSDGHITDKIMRVLNAMYKEFTERNGSEPIPLHVFNERKKIIERQSAIS